jgi:hypothetical protein
MLPFIQRNALRRFVSGKPGPWGAVAVVAIGMRTMQRMSARRSNVVFREVLPPGQELLVTHRDDLTQREARSRRKRKAEARDAAAEQKAAKKEARRVKRATAALSDAGS